MQFKVNYLPISDSESIKPIKILQRPYRPGVSTRVAILPQKTFHQVPAPQNCFPNLHQTHDKPPIFLIRSAAGQGRAGQGRAERVPCIGEYKGSFRGSSQAIWASIALFAAGCAPLRGPSFRLDRPELYFVVVITAVRRRRCRWQACLLKMKKER